MTNIATTYLSRWPKSSDTYSTMRAALDSVARALDGKDALSFPWEETRYDSARVVPARLAEMGLKPRSINKVLSALRGVLETAWRMGMISETEYRRIEIPNVRGKGLPTGRALDTGEVDRIFSMLDTLPARDAAIIAVLVSCGLRRIEVVRLRYEDYCADEGIRLRARGKGGKERAIPVAPRWRSVIEAWWKKARRGETVFRSATGRPITRRTVSYVIEKLSAQLGGLRFTPHDLRRTFVTRVCQASDLAIAQHLAGHEMITTTQLYDRRGVACEDEAVKDL